MKELDYIKQDVVLTSAVILAIISSIFSRPKLAYIDFKVLILLFNLMVVVATFKELRVLDYIATAILKKCHTYTTISLALVSITFVLAMFVTNDVALITFVPLTLIIAQKAKCDPMKIVIFQTLAANLGSSLTPMGNPQNLYIYSFYKMTPTMFISTMMPMTVLATLVLAIFILKDHKKIEAINIEMITLGDKKQIIIFSLLFVVIVLSVFQVLDYRIVCAMTIISVLIIDKKLLKKIDYSLLVTFVGFFIFIGNLSAMEPIKNFMQMLLSTGKETFWVSLVASQVISNVPATMLISGFTPYYKELLLGVNIGGMGTLIASLASVIAYKQYIKEYPEQAKLYMRNFIQYNAVGLMIFVTYVSVCIIK